MVGVEPPASPAPTPIGARLAERGVRPRRVSAKRSWPPGCGRFPAAPPAPEARDGEKGAADGVVEARAEEALGHAGVLSPACNGGLLHVPPQPEPERVVEEVEGRKEGGEAQPPGDGEVRPSDGQEGSRAMDVMPLAFASPQSFSVPAANGSVENSGHGANSSPMEGKGGLGSGQLVREEDVTGNGHGRETVISADDDELERKEDGHYGVRKKRWLMSVVNPPPKRRAISAIRKFPPGCGRAAVTVTDSRGEEELALEATPISFASGGASVPDALPADPISGHVASPVFREDASALPADPISGHVASPVFREDASDEETEGKGAKVEGASQSRHRIQESQAVNGVGPDDFARGRHDNVSPRNAATKDSPPHGCAENVNGKRPLHEGKRVALGAEDCDVRSKREGSSREGTSKTVVRGHVDVKTKGKRPESAKKDETLLDDTVVSGEGTIRNKTSSTQKGLVRSNINMKQDMVARKLMRDGIGKGSLNRYAKESKCGNHVATDQTEENDGLDLVTNRIIVQALMAPDKCPWTKGKKSIASVSRCRTPRNMSLTPRNKLKKNDATPRKELLPKVTPSTSTRHEIIEDKEDSSSEDYDNSMALVVHEKKNELCVTLPPCAPSGDQSPDARSKVRKLLKLFQLICRKLMQAEEQHIRNVGRIDIEAVNAIKKYPGYTKHGPIVGSVPGVVVGDEFHFRVELSIVGLHRLYQGGIDTTKVDGIPVAISIVASGGYPDELSSSDELIYTGSGGKAIGKKEAEDQKLKGGNLALKNSIETKNPVRVIHGFKGQSRGEAGHSKSKQISTYTYDGLYYVVDCWQEGATGSMVFKYKLQRIPGQPELALHIVKETRQSKVRKGLCLPDISQGKERIPICVINTIDDMQPTPFTYITKVIYPPTYAKEPPKGCDCTDGCSDSNRCACAVKNGGEIPFNFNGAIVHAKPLIYECGPSCRCPPTCHNRVSQHGVKIPLEIFKTGETGWGVRSLSSISSGSFICEYGGELLQDTEAEKTQNDEYLFDIGHNYDDEELWKGLPSMIPGLQSSTSETMEDDVGFTIDAAKCGNVGRFINHSCSPNLYAQNVLWDHDDKRMPHIMFFAAENIPPLQELTYHYNYTIGQVRDNNGQEKAKDCFCGSSDCSGRLY